jgi:hypothetical protein
VTGTYWWGRANAGKVQLTRNTVCLPNLPGAFDGFTILHLSDLHADISGSAMRRTAELVLDLDYDLCVLTGDYRGRTHGDCMPCLEGVARLRERLRGDIYAVLGNHDSIGMVHPWARASQHSSATNRRILAISACSWVIIGLVAAAHPKDETSLCADKSSEGGSKPSQVTILLSQPTPHPLPRKQREGDPIVVTRNWVQRNEGRSR